MKTNALSIVVPASGVTPLTSEEIAKRTARPAGLRLSSSRLRAGFTLVEVLVVVAALVSVAALAIAGITQFQKKKNARATVALMRQVDANAKQQLRDQFINGSGFPTGYTIDTIGTYAPTLVELAPFLKLPGHVEGDTNITDTDVVGPGRTLILGTLDEATNCTPPIDATLVGNGYTATGG